MKFSEIVSYVSKNGQKINLVAPNKQTRSQLADRFVRAIPYIFGVFAEKNSTRILLSNYSTIDIYDADWVKNYKSIKCTKVDEEADNIAKGEL